MQWFKTPGTHQADLPKRPISAVSAGIKSTDLRDPRDEKDVARQEVIATDLRKIDLRTVFEDCVEKCGRFSMLTR